MTDADPLARAGATVTERGHGYVVVDELLGEETRHELDRYLATLPHETIRVRSGLTYEVETFDEPCHRGPRFLFGEVPGDLASETTYPTGAVIDRLFEVVQDTCRGLASDVDWLDDRHWRFVNATPWRYPRGSGFAMHDDGSEFYTAAFVYFSHPRWRVHWGGSLLIGDDRPRPTGERPVGERLAAIRAKRATDADDQSFVGNGLYRCVVPVPDRLVLLTPTVLHMVARVDPAAGDAARTSVVGFFAKATSPPEPAG